jgi:hypothetical protein
MSFGHKPKKPLIQLNGKLDDPNAEAWDPTLAGRRERIHARRTCLLLPPFLRAAKRGGQMGVGGGPKKKLE